MSANPDDPHGAIRIVTSGAPLSAARGAMILLHGRGSAAESMLELAAQLAPADFAVFAPQAYEYSWYPHRFIRPVRENEPKLTSALNAVTRVLKTVTVAGIPASRVVIGGFSQGACLALEFAARYPIRYGGILGFSGGLIGDERTPLPPPTEGKPLAGTPIFIGSSKRDAHIPAARVYESAAILMAMGAQVTLKLYEGDDHTINDDEITHALGVMKGVEPS